MRSLMRRRQPIAARLSRRRPLPRPSQLPRQRPIPSHAAQGGGRAASATANKKAGLRNEKTARQNRAVFVWSKIADLIRARSRLLGISGLQVVAPDVVGDALRHVAAGRARVAPVNTAIGSRDHHLILKGGERGIGARGCTGVRERGGAEGEAVAESLAKGRCQRTGAGGVTGGMLGVRGGGENRLPGVVVQGAESIGLVRGNLAILGNRAAEPVMVLPEPMVRMCIVRGHRREGDDPEQVGARLANVGGRENV